MVPGAVPEIETERLILREPVPADLDVWAAFNADPDVARYLPRRKITPRERAESLLDAIQRMWEQPASGCGWAVMRKADQQFIGWCTAEHLASVNEVELSYLYGKPYWGQGFATEAARAACHFTFEHSAWDRIVATIVPGNAASRRVLDHLGFVYEKDVNYHQMTGDFVFQLESPILPYFVLLRERFAPGNGFYRVRSSAT
jgi:RimJ/RimL family protein N-acetyltransferase